MIKCKKSEKGNFSVVYDISADGTFVNALGMNVLHNTDGFNFKLPDSQSFRYTKEHPYIGLGLSRETKEGKEYTGFEADVAEFNDMYMKDFHYSPLSVNKMGLGIDEVVDATINFSRKNYADYFPTKPYPDDVKMVGNTIKSKKMPEYIAKFLSKGVRMLLRGEGQEFIDEYYNYLSKIYNFQIPLRDIASKGKIKKSTEQYLKDIQEITKAGRPKSRQAWYELAIANNLHVDNGDTIYYVNTGKSKSHSDVKKITHYYIINESNEKVEITKEIDSKYKKYKQSFESNIGRDMTPVDKKRWMENEYGKVYKEEEIVLNCVLVPNDIVNSEDDTFCNDENGIEYNTAKYIDMFNSRIKPLLVCFSKDIRSRILVNNPDDRQYFTAEECQLVSGQPNKPSDQDTYEQLMTMEDKEIKFWTKYNLIPPFVEECGMGKWEDIVKDYNERMQKEKELGVDKEKENFFAVLNGLSKDDIDSFVEDGSLPSVLTKMADIDPTNGNFVSKNYPDVTIATLTDVVDIFSNREMFEETDDTDAAE